MHFSYREDIIQLTPQWKGARLSDGRPKVSDSVLERIRHITLEEAWSSLWNRGFHYQFQGDLKLSNTQKNLVGRAVTATFMPIRPDLHSYLMDFGQNDEGRTGNYSQWVIDTLREDDVVVCDLFDKVYQGAFVGGNLCTAIAQRTKQGGAVIWGGIRDLEQIVKMPDIQVMYRGCDPTDISDVMMTGFNSACRIGAATCLPGDIVLGSISGVLFIPAYLAQTVADDAEKSHVRDLFAFRVLQESKKYTISQIDSAWTIDILEDFLQWIDEDEAAAPYRHLNWATEREAAQKAAQGASTVKAGKSWFYLIGRE